MKLKMVSRLWSAAGSAVTKCPDFELCVRVPFPSPWLRRRRPAERLHCPLVVGKIPFIKPHRWTSKQTFLHLSMYERMCTAQEVSVLSPVPLSQWLMAPLTADGVGRRIKALDSGRPLSRKGTGLGCLLDLFNSDVTSTEHLEMF